MGYPVLTRLGLSQFWYKHWYTDLQFQEFVLQDKLFSNFLKFYLNYGLDYKNNIFFNEYFFNKYYKNYKYKFKILNLKFFRKFYFSNTILGIEHSYLTRLKTGEYFPLRLWCIKYSSWIILSFHCFKPVKVRARARNKISKEVHSISPSLSFSDINIKYIRYKLLFLFFKKNLINLKYLF